MPFGFRGVPARIYLQAVEDALKEAADAHSLDPFRSTVSQIAPLPPLRPRDNQKTPHAPATADSGGNIVGVGRSANIVVGSSDYGSLIRNINQAENSFGTTIYGVASSIDRLVEDSFEVPLTSQEVRIIALGVKNSLSEFGSLTSGIEVQINTFISNILDIG